MIPGYLKTWLLTSTYDPQSASKVYSVAVGAENAHRVLGRLVADVERRPTALVVSEQVIVEDLDRLLGDREHGKAIRDLLVPLTRYGRQRGVRVIVRSETPLTPDLLDRGVLAETGGGVW